MCHVKGHNAVAPVRLEPATPLSQVKHSTTEQLRSRVCGCVCVRVRVRVCMRCMRACVIMYKGQCTKVYFEDFWSRGCVWGGAGCGPLYWFSNVSKYRYIEKST